MVNWFKVLTWILIPTLLYEGVAYGLYQTDTYNLPSIYTSTQKTPVLNIANVQQLNPDNLVPIKFVRDSEVLPYDDAFLLKVYLNYEKPLALEKYNILGNYDIISVNETISGSSELIPIGLTGFLFKTKTLFLSLSIPLPDIYVIEIELLFLDSNGVKVDRDFFTFSLHHLI